MPHDTQRSKSHDSAKMRCPRWDKILKHEVRCLFPELAWFTLYFTVSWTCHCVEQSWDKQISVVSLSSCHSYNGLECEEQCPLSVRKTRDSWRILVDSWPIEMCSPLEKVYLGYIKCPLYPDIWGRELDVGRQWDTRE